MKILIALAAAGLVVGGASAAIAQRPNAWRIIGYKIVGGGTDRDVIRVRGEKRDRQLRLCAINRAIHMVDFKVIFANGGRQDVPVRSMIAAGSCTRNIDLKGPRGRNIQEVRLTYERLDRRAGTPLIRVMAR